MKKFDLLIINKGISGLALACGLSKYLNIVIIENNMSNCAIQINQEYIQTISWINLTSIRILKHLKLWNKNISLLFNPICNLNIIKNNSIKNKVVFESGYLGYPELGYVADYQLIYVELIKHIKKFKNITFLESSCLLKTIYYKKDEALIKLNSGDIYSVQLIIGADGINSRIRNNINIPITFNDMNYYSVTGVVYSEKHHNNLLRCIINKNNLMILLPLTDPRCSFIFWVLPFSMVGKYLYKELVDQVYSLNFDLSVIFYRILGETTMYNNEVIQIFPMRLQYAHNFVRHRFILLGESAYVKCPLIFQNINIELLDAVILYNYLRKLKQSNKDIGHYFYLKSYNKTQNSISMNIMNALYAHILKSNSNFLGYIIWHCIYNLLKMDPYFHTYMLKKIMGLHAVPSWLLE